MLNAAWADRQADLTALSQEVADLADGVRRAAQGYPAADLRVAEALNPNDFSSLPISAAEPFAPAPKPVAPAPPATSWGQPSLRSGGPLWTL